MRLFDCEKVVCFKNVKWQTINNISQYSGGDDLINKKNKTYFWL